MEQFSIPINLLRQYIFCPRIPFFLAVLGIRPETPLWVKQGSSQHKKQELLMKNRTLKRFNLREAKLHFDLSIDSNGIHGKCDCLIETSDAVYPVEFKASMEKHRGYIFQLAAYGISASTKFAKKCEEGFIVHSLTGKTLSILITDKIKEELINTISDLNLMLSKSQMPDSSASVFQCGQCEFLNFCNDRF